MAARPAPSMMRMLQPSITLFLAVHTSALPLNDAQSSLDSGVSMQVSQACSGADCEYAQRYGSTAYCLNYNSVKGPGQNRAISQICGSGENADCSGNYGWLKCDRPFTAEPWVVTSGSSAGEWDVIWLGYKNEGSQFWDMWWQRSDGTIQYGKGAYGSPGENAWQNLDCTNVIQYGQEWPGRNAFPDPNNLGTYTYSSGKGQGVITAVCFSGKNGDCSFPGLPSTSGPYRYMVACMKVAGELTDPTPMCPQDQYKGSDFASAVAPEGYMITGYCNGGKNQDCKCQTSDGHIHNQHNAATIHKYTAFPPPSPPPTPPPRPPQACASYAVEDSDCSLPALFCRSGTSLIFDETLANGDMEGYANAWTKKCGLDFWAHGYPWADLAGATETCFGSSCLPPATAEGSKATCADMSVCGHTDAYYGNGCTFTLDRYAPYLVYLCQIASTDVLATIGVSPWTSATAATPTAPYYANTTTQQGAMIQLKSIMSTFATYLTPAGANSAAALVSSQIGSLSAITAMLGKVTSGVQGFVPGYSYDFYTTKLKRYFETFSSLSTTMQTSITEGKLLSLFFASLSVEQTKTNSIGVVFDSLESTTLMTVESSIDRMNAALDGLDQMSHEITYAGDDLKYALEEWKKEQRTRAILGLVKATANLVKGVGTFVATGGLSAVGTASMSGMDMFNLMATFKDLALSVGEASSTVAQTSDVTVSQEFREQNSKLAGQLTSQGVVIPDTSYNDTVEALTEIIQELNSILPGMGTGYWESYYANAATSINPFLIGYNAEVNTAAQHYLDLVRAQTYYGNDFVTAATRYVSGLQTLIIVAAQKAAQLESTAGVNDAYAVGDEMETYDMMQQGIISIEMTTVAMGMSLTVAQICESYRYQITRLYSQCVTEATDTTNVLYLLCGDASNGMPGFTPFFNEPCIDDNVLAQNTQTYFDLQRKMYENANYVGSYVSAQNWGSQVSGVKQEFMDFNLTVWKAAECKESDWTPTSSVTICNTTESGESSKVTLLPDVSSCFPANATDIPSELACCHVTSADNNGCHGEPPDYPYITEAQLAAFTDKLNPKWGELTFSLTPAMIRKLWPQWGAYAEIFVSGMAVYIKGALIDAYEAGKLRVSMQPAGQMLNMVKNASWDKDPECYDIVAGLIDTSNACRYTNHTFIGAPSGEHTVVAYDFDYSNVDANGKCKNAGEKKPVFYSGRELEEMCPVTADSLISGVSQCEYCTSTDLASLESGNVYQLYVRSTGSPYNFASLYGTFTMKIGNNNHRMDSIVGLRSSGIDLSSMESIYLGFWLQTHGNVNAANKDTCRDIKSKGQFYSSAGGVPSGHVTETTTPTE